MYLEDIQSLQKNFKQKFFIIYKRIQTNPIKELYNFTTIGTLKPLKLFLYNKDYIDILV